MELHTSETISDTTNSSTNNELSLSFDVVNGGTETVYVDDKLLTNYDVAKARAESIFLDEGYVTKRVTFSTYHIDNLHIGDTIQLDGLLFKVINIVDKIKGAVVSMDITAERAVSTTSLDVTFVFVTSSRIYYAMSSPDGYMYGGTQNNGQIYRSLDGITWALVYDDSVFAKVSKIVYNEADGYLYAVLTATDTKFIRSLNGMDWEERDTITAEYFSDFVFFNGYLYIATYTSISGVYSTKIRRSLNIGSSTTVLTFDERIYQFIVKDSSLFFSSFKMGIESIYKDLVKIANISTSDYISVLSIYDGYLVGANDTGKVYKSIDGITWQKVLDNMEYEIYTMSSHSNGVYIPTNAGKILFSNDLITWHEIYDLTGTVSWLWAIASHGGSVFVFDSTSNCYKVDYVHGNQ